MANKAFNKKGFSERYYTSIVDYNAANRTAIRLMPFTDDNGVTDFKCASGYKSNGTPAYIKEYFALMWGVTEVTQYCELAQGALANIELQGEVIEACEGGHNMKYTVKKGIFRRWYYNVLIEIDNIRYYLYIKTSAGSRFKQIMTDFCKDK